MREIVPIRRPEMGERLRFMSRLPNLLSLYWRLWKDGRVSWVAKSLPILALFYVVLPVDAILDYIPALGQLDDAAIIMLALRGFVRLSPSHVVDEHSQAVGLQ